MRSPNIEAVVAYVASPHNGYLKLFRKYEGAALYILGNEFIQEFPSLARHLPANTPEDAKRMIAALGIFSEVKVLTANDLPELSKLSIVMPDEDVSRAIAERHLAGADIRFDGSWRLRWDWGNTNAHRKPECKTTISHEDFDREMMGLAEEVSQRSPDWWRQIGALLVKDSSVLFVAFNQHLPSEQSAYLEGDPRSNFELGQFIDASLALHAEVGILAEAARRGISTAGCDLYVSTFPCPPCANACAKSGIKRLFYRTGYSLVAGAETLLKEGVEIIRVE